MFGNPKSRYCPYCCRRRRLVYNWHNYAGVHAAATVLTCGLWFPIAVVYLLTLKQYVCERCGTAIA